MSFFPPRWPLGFVVQTAELQDGVEPSDLRTAFCQPQRVEHRASGAVGLGTGLGGLLITLTRAQCRFQVQNF